MAQAARAMQLQIRAQMLRDVTTVWPALNLNRVSATWPAWLRIMTALIGKYHGQQAQQAALFYSAARQLQTGSHDPAVIKLAASPSTQWIERALGYAGPGTYTRRVAIEPDLADRRALDPSVGHQFPDRARRSQNHRHQQRGSGPHGGRLLPRHGLRPVRILCANGLPRRRIPNRASAAGVGNKWHNDCGCTIAPAFTRNIELPEISLRAAQVYANRGRGQP
jgi:hypothetical protein